MDKDMKNIIDWLMEMELVEEEDTSDITEDLLSIKKVAPRFYNMFVLLADK